MNTEEYITLKASTQPTKEKNICLKGSCNKDNVSSLIFRQYLSTFL